MKNLVFVGENIVTGIQNFLFLLVTALALTMPIFADCKKGDVPENYRKTVVTYYDLDYPAGSDFDSRCNYFTDSNGKRICRIRLRGTLYRPLEATQTRGSQPKQYPTLLINHGSKHFFEPETKFCTLAEYFVPKGYMIFAPFRRGRGDENSTADRSTGVYVSDMIEDWDSGDPKYGHKTNCTTRSCYKAQLLRKRADEEVALAMEYLKKRPDVKRDAKNPKEYDIAIMGISYGGAVTVFANRLDLRQKASVAFRPAHSSGIRKSAPRLLRAAAPNSSAS